MRHLIYFSILLIILTGNCLFGQQNKIQAEKYFDIANILYEKSDYKNAIIYYDSTILSNTDHVEAYAFRGLCFFELKQFEMAIRDFDFALMLAPGYAEVFYFRGIAKNELGYVKQACEDWFEAYNLGFKKAMNIIEINCKEELEKKVKKSN